MLGNFPGLCLPASIRHKVHELIACIMCTLCYLSVNPNLQSCKSKKNLLKFFIQKPVIECLMNSIECEKSLPDIEEVD